MCKTNLFFVVINEGKLGHVNEGGTWRIRYNRELNDLNKEPKLMDHIKLKRLHWARHVVRMSEDTALISIYWSTRRKTASGKTENAVEG